MSLKPRIRFRALVVATLSLGLLAGGATVASATEGTDASAIPVESFEGNDRDKCEGAGIEGDLLTKGDEITGVISGDDNQYLTITEVADGVTVNGISVKGGPGYNVYTPAGFELPWKKLVSPENKGGNIPAISHWIACGTVTAPTTTTSEKPTETTPSSPTESTTPGETTETSTDDVSTSESTSSAGAPVETTETSDAAPSPAADSGDLASTGFGSGWLIVLGALLLAGGVALVVLTKFRRGNAS